MHSVRAGSVPVCSRRIPSASGRTLKQELNRSIAAENLAASFKTCINVFNVLEKNKKYINQNPKCEPQLGKRGIYHHIGGHSDSKNFQLAMLWVLNLSDGHHSLVDISERSGLKFGLIADAAKILISENLLNLS